MTAVPRAPIAAENQAIYFAVKLSLILPKPICSYTKRRNLKPPIPTTLPAKPRTSGKRLQRRNAAAMRLDGRVNTIARFMMNRMAVAIKASNANSPPEASITRIGIPNITAKLSIPFSKSCIILLGPSYLETP